jgi:putative ABC transport system permease protein
VSPALDAHQIVGLERSTAYLVHPSPPFEAFGGSALSVATPQLLRAFGINPSEVNPNADIPSRPGFSSISSMDLTWCKSVQPPQHRSIRTGAPINPLCANPGVLKNPLAEQVGALPPGISAPNIVLTEHAIQVLGIEDTVQTGGWSIEAAHPLTAAQIQGAETTAAAAGMTIESMNDQPSSTEVIDSATVVGIALALCILAMSVGLIRSETASDLRTLAASGAASRTRRTITAATAGALGLTGAFLGTVSGYLGVIGWMLDRTSENGLARLGNIPVANLRVILIGIPCRGGRWLAGRRPRATGHRPSADRVKSVA